jgi:hypothetical protein
MPDSRDLHAADLPWSIPITPHPERIPGLDILPPDLLVSLAFSMQDDLASLRLVLHETLRALATVTAERDRLRQAIRGMR